MFFLRTPNAQISFILRKYRTSQIHPVPIFVFYNFCRSLSILDELWMVLVRSWTCACAESRAKRRVLAHPASSCAALAARPAPENCVSRLLRQGRPRLCWKTVSRGPCVTAGPDGKTASQGPCVTAAPDCWKTASQAALRHGPASGRPGKLFLKRPCVTARWSGQQKLSLSVFSSCGAVVLWCCAVTREEQIPRFARESVKTGRTFEKQARF